MQGSIGCIRAREAPRQVPGSAIMNALVNAAQQRQRPRDLTGSLEHARIETTQLYAQTRPAALKHAVEFYESKALDVLDS